MKRVQSYEDARRRRSSALRLVRYVAFLYLGFALIVTFGFKTYTVGSRSMRPTLDPKDKIIVASSAYGVVNPFNGQRLGFRPPERGDVALVRLPSAPSRDWKTRLADSVIGFLTLQRLGAPGASDALDSPVVKRVIALPGDAVSMSGYVVRVRVAGSEHFLTEYEVSGRDYDIVSDGPTEGWTSSLPLSGEMPAFELGPGEFFVVDDDRSYCSDSRFFGPVKAERFVGKALLRYWPLDRVSGF